jgi:hypothetical protein
MSSPSETAQVMTGHSEPLLLRHIPHRPAHSLICDPDEPRRNIFHRVWLGSLPIRIDLSGKLLKLDPRGGYVKWLVGARAEDAGELRGDETAENEVCVGNGE